jgi:hypothetical protein
LNPTQQQYLIAVEEHNTPLLSNCSANNPNGATKLSSGSKLGTGAKVGIAFGVTIGALAISVVATFIFRKKRIARLNHPVGYQTLMALGMGDIAMQKTMSAHLDDVHNEAPSTELSAENRLRDPVELPLRMDALRQKS